MPRLVQLPISAVPSVRLHVADEAAYQTYLEQLAQHQKRFPETWARVPMTTEKPKSAKSRAKIVTNVSHNENSMHHHHRHHHHHRSGSSTSLHSHSQTNPSPSPTSHPTPSSVSAEDAFVMSLLSLSHDDEPSHVTPSSPDPTLISTSSESTDAHVHVQSLPDLPVSHMDLPDLDEIAKLPPSLLLAAECTPLSELSRSSSMMLSNAPVLLSHLNHSASMPDLSNSTASSVHVSSPDSSIVTSSSPQSHHHRRASTPLYHHRRRAQRVVPVIDRTLSPAIKRISSTLAQGGYRHHPYAHTRTSSQISVPY